MLSYLHQWHSVAEGPLNAEPADGGGVGQNALRMEAQFDIELILN
jgi:hypothetical protein